MVFFFLSGNSTFEILVHSHSEDDTICMQFGGGYLVYWGMYVPLSTCTNVTVWSTGDT